MSDANPENICSKRKLQDLGVDIGHLPDNPKEAYLMLYYVLDPRQCAPGLLLENSQRKVTRINAGKKGSWHTVLSKVAMWKGVHLWRIDVNWYQQHGEICVGITEPGMDLNTFMGSLR